MPGAAMSQGRGGLDTGYYAQPRGGDLPQSVGPQARGGLDTARTKQSWAVLLETGATETRPQAEQSRHGRNAARRLFAPQTHVESTQDAWPHGTPRDARTQGSAQPTSGACGTSSQQL